MGKLKILGDVVEGGLGMMRNALKAEDAVKELTAAERVAAGRKAAELIKSQPLVKASEALGQQMEKGMKRTTTTQADRTRVGGGNIGGAPFSAISEADPNYAGKVWGVMDEGTAARLKNLTEPETAWTTMLGSANQLKTNPIVFDKLKRGFVDSMKQGNLSDELAGKINHNLELTFGAGADIRDPKIWRQADTFEKRAALADVMMGQGTAPSKGGVAIGGEKSGRGVIFQPTDILKRETEPSLLHTEHGGDVPTFAAGPRLFRLDKESEFRPDLHPGFPTLLKGEDLGVNMRPTPTEIYLPDWHKKFKKDNPERKAPGYYDLALGVKGEGLPSQELNDEYIRHLLREGFKDGGKVGDFDAKVDKLIEKHHFDNHVNNRIEEHFAKGGMPKLARTSLRMAGGGLLGKGAKALVGVMKGAQALPAVEREANLAKFLEPSKVPERLYHGTTATEGGKGTEAIRRIKPSKEGALGSGVYMTPNQRYANMYGSGKSSVDLKEVDQSGNVLPVHAQIRNPLVIEGTGDPMIEALTKLGMEEDKAARMVERAYEEKGYIGKQVESRARAAGYDGLMQYRDGELSEVVSYNPNAVKSAIGNQGTYDINHPDLSKAKGGVILKHTTLRNRKTSQAQPNRYADGGITLAQTSLRDMGDKNEATMQATPRNKFLGAASDLLKSGHEFVSKPFGYNNPPAEMLSDFVGIPAASRVLDKLSYGEPITNYGKANVQLIPDETVDAFSLGMGAISPLSKLAKPLTKAIKMPELGNAVSSSVKLTGLQPEVKTALTGKPQGATYATKQEGPFYRVSPTSLDVTGAKSRGLREADELQSQASVAGSAGEVGREVPLRISDEEVARLISNPETNQPLQIAQRFTKETQGTDFAAPNIPESSLAKQSAIGRAHQLAIEGSPEYKTSVFDAYAKQMPDILEQAGAKNYDDLMEKAYRQLAKETDEQFKQLPYNFSYHRKGEGDYLGGSKDMMADVHGNKHLYVFQGGDPHDFLNQMDKASGLNENEKFRAVHDLLGHAIYGNQFGPKGEEAAWAIHQQMYSPLARLAMTSETRGQNSLVNYSPLNVKLKSSIAKLEDLEVEARRRGDKALVNELQAAKRQEFANNFQFAPQKAVLLPPEFVDPKFAGGLPDYLSAANRPAKGTETQSVLTHFSNDPKLQMLDPKRYGTGIKGAEAERLNEYAGGVKDRSYVYLGEPGTIAPEPGLGVNRYRGESQNLYDITQDPLAFRALARESNRTPFTAKYNAGITHPLQEANDYERLVKEYGYEGMINPNASKPMGIMFKPTPVQPRARGGLTQLKAR